jgi:hypothetical protein
MPEATQTRRTFDGPMLLGLRMVLLGLALLAGACVSEGVLEAWQGDGQNQTAK